MPTSKRFTWKDPSRLTLAVMTIMAMDIVWALIGLAIQIERAERGAHGSTTTAAATEYVLVLAYSLLALIVVLTAPVLVFWILRVSKNAHVLKGRPLSNSPLFAALWWYVIPFMWFFKPVEALGEIWDVSASSHERRKDHRLILRLWWGAFLTSIVASNLARLLGRDSIIAVAIALAASVVECGAFLFIARHIRDLQLEKHLARTFSDETDYRPSILQRLND